MIHLKNNVFTEEKLVGYYCWAGPGTVRMLDLKYFSPRVDTVSLMSSYDKHYLKQLSEKLEVTDFWATYSWGFNQQTEQLDHQFLIDRIPNFKQHSIRLHAYIQGTNLVTAEFPDQDFWARDSFGRYCSYHRGRRLTCVNNPAFQDYFYTVVTEAVQHDFDGVYIDNVNMGQMVPPIFGKELFFVGCRCQYCLSAFKNKTGQTIPQFLSTTSSEVVAAYLQFRADSLHSFLNCAAKIAHKKNKLFGSNSFDPKFDSVKTYGYDYANLARFQDYLLFETHSFPNSDGTTNNQAVERWAKKVPIPVFALSYQKGISYDAELTQDELILLKSDAAAHTFNLCYKGSEFVTNGVWHNLNLDMIPKKIANHNYLQRKEQTGANSLTTSNNQWLVIFGALVYLPLTAVVVNYFFGILNYLIMEKKQFRPLMSLIYGKVVV